MVDGQEPVGGAGVVRPGSRAVAVAVNGGHAGVGPVGCAGVVRPDPRADAVAVNGAHACEGTAGGTGVVRPVSPPAADSSGVGQVDSVLLSWGGF